MQISNRISELCGLLKASNPKHTFRLLTLVFEHRLAFRVLSEEQSFEQWKSALAIQNKMILQEFEACINSFNKNTIRAIAFKGPALSQELYQNPGSRQYSDLDFFIPQYQIKKSMRVLEGLGYYKSEYSEGFEERFLIKFSNVIVLKHEKNGVEIELHWQPFSETLSKYNKAIGNVFEHSQNINVNSTRVAVLDVETNLKYLLLHGHKHQWFRLGWLFDFMQLVEKSGLTYCKTLFKNTHLSSIFNATIGLGDLLFEKKECDQLTKKEKRLLHNYLNIINDQEFPPKIRGFHYFTIKYLPFNSLKHNWDNLLFQLYYPSNSDYLKGLNFAPVYLILKPLRYLWRL